MSNAYTCSLQSISHGIMLIGVLAAGGMLLQPLSQYIDRQERAAGLKLPPVAPKGNDALSKQLAIFSLGGLRSLAAEILAIDATNAWLQQDWERARNRWGQITTICPHRANYWARAARDMAKNAVAHTYERNDLSEHEQAVLAKSYLDEAEQFLLQGLADNPQSVLLQLELAAFYEDLARRPQFAKAIDAYKKAVEMGASPMYKRWVFYNLCRVRGREQEAWQLGRQLFREKRHRTPSVKCLLFMLQNKLGNNIAPADRLSIEAIFGSEERAVKALRPFRHNSLRFPTTGVGEYLDQR